MAAKGNYVFDNKSDVSLGLNQFCVRYLNKPFTIFTEGVLGLTNFSKFSILAITLDSGSHLTSGRYVAYQNSILRFRTHPLFL